MIQYTSKKIYVFILILMYGCLINVQAGQSGKGGFNMKSKVKSTAFEEGGMIPSKYTCDGVDVSPQLS